MFSSARLTTIILSVIALGLILSVLVDATSVKVDKRTEFLPGGETIGGPGIVEDLTPSGTQLIWLSDPSSTRLTCLTLHCRKGSAKGFLQKSGGTFLLRGPSDNDRTISGCVKNCNRVEVRCESGSPGDCDCLWRIDQGPAD